MEGHMRTSTRLAVVGAGALFLVLPVTAASAAPDAPARPHPLRVSGASPFAGCTAGGTATSTNFPGAEVEPSLPRSLCHAPTTRCGRRRRSEEHTSELQPPCNL